MADPRAGFRRYSIYRQAVVAGLATNVVFGFMRCAVLLTVFAGSAQVAGYTPSTRSCWCSTSRRSASI